MITLLVVHTNSYFSNLLPIAQLLARTGEWEPRFLFASRYPTLDRDVVRCREEGFACESVSTEPPPQIVRSIVWRIRDNVAYVAMQHAATIRRLRRAIRDQNIELLILPADNRYDLAAYVKAAHAEGIPAVAVPAFMAAATEWAQFVLDDPDHSLSRLSNRVAAKIYPRWVHSHDGRLLLAMPAGEVFARQWLGLAPPMPWTLHSGHADVIALESEAMRQYCFREGLPSRQLVLTGSIDHDFMHARLSDATALREALYRRLGLPERPMALTALPPDWLYGRGRKECDFISYHELVRFWLATLTGRAFNVLVSLHPSVKRETMAYVEDYGVKIIDEPTSHVVPLCDVYVASVSATIQWAIACGKPVVNYDVYRFRYPDYLGIDGVLNFEEQSEYVAAIRRVADTNMRAELAAGQARGAKYWGILDGKAGERLLALFNEVVQARRA